MGRKRKANDGRRKPGTGYATEAPNGTWIGHFPKAVGTGYHVKRGFDTRPAAEAWCDSLAAQRDQKIDVGSGRMKLSDWLDRWKVRNAKEREWKAKTIVDIDWKLGYVKPHIGDMAISDILPDHIDTMLDALGQDLAQSTTRQIRNYLYDAFEEARERHYIAFNPVIKPRRRKRAKQREPQRLSFSQAALLLRSAESSFSALAWWLVLTLGLRAGEICGLRWGDVDLDHGVLHVLQEVTDVRGVPTKDTPKNDQTRHVPIARALIPLFHLHYRAYLKRAAQGVQKGYWQENGLVFPGRGGRPMNPTSLRHQLHDLTDACKLPPVTTHMLRHTAGKFYTDVGTEHMMTKAILGHTPDITGHYAPPDPDAMRPWTEKVYARISGEVERLRKAS